MSKSVEDGFVVDICAEAPNLSEVTHELSAVKFELTKLQSILQQVAVQLNNLQRAWVIRHGANVKKLRIYKLQKCSKNFSATEEYLNVR